MVTEKNFLSFGRYLKAIRLEKGISLKEVSRETRVGIETLLLVEKEDHNRLPAEVFVKGFLRAYAKVVGADDDVVVQLYLSNRRAFQETFKPDVDLIESSPKFWPRLFFSIGALLCIIVSSVFGISFFQKPYSNDDSFKQPAVSKNFHDIASKDSEVLGSGSEKPGNNPEKMLLKIMANENTWLKITIDDHRPKEYSLHPGDRLDFEASSAINLLIGNAGGVKLILNESPLEVAGKSGQVVRIQVPQKQR